MSIRMQSCGATCALLALTVVTGAQNTTDESQSNSIAANGSVAIVVDSAGDEGMNLHGPPAPNRVEATADIGDGQSIEAAGEPSSIEDAKSDKPAAESGVGAAPEPELGPFAAGVNSLTETQPLGVPNGLFSARPVPDAGAAGESLENAKEQSLARSFVSAVDPRSNPVARVVASLGLVLGLILLFKVVMKRGAGLLGQGGRPSGVIEILARYPLGRKQSLVLIKLARRVLLVHQNGTQMSMLSEVAEPMEVAALLSRIESGSTGRQAQRFRSMLKRFESEHDAMRQMETDDPFASSTGNESSGELIDLTRRRPRANGLGKRRLTA